MTDITREEAIKEILSWTPTLLSMGEKCTDKTMIAQKMAIADMKRVAQLESNLKQSHDTKLTSYLKAENKWLTDLLYEQIKNLDNLNLETERLEDGIEKVKEEIKHTDFDMMDYYDHTETIREMVLNVINKHLGGKK